MSISFDSDSWDEPIGAVVYSTTPGQKWNLIMDFTEKHFPTYFVPMDVIQWPQEDRVPTTVDGGGNIVTYWDTNRLLAGAIHSHYPVSHPTERIDS